MQMADGAVWFITGCSTGFGRELATLIAKRGWPLVATARNKAALDGLAGDNVLKLDLDVTKLAQITAAIEAAEERFGRVDVLVNNAGYGYQAAVEEGNDADIRMMFDANVFGLFAMTRAVLPGMRTRRRGHIINISSVAGFSGGPGSAYYAASKHAVEGFSKGLSAEVAPLGLHVTCVEPGPFRTDFAGRSIQRKSVANADYEQTVGARFREMSDYSGKQAGDPVRASEAIIALTEKEKPPFHAVFGKVGYKVVTRQLAAALAEVEANEAMALGTDFPKED
jgi:NAD(P)-dependent dehydrogenase (short-subunit alcohol dehydrogenase family)